MVIKVDKPVITELAQGRFQLVDGVKIVFVENRTGFQRVGFVGVAEHDGHVFFTVPSCLRRTGVHFFFDLGGL